MTRNMHMYFPFFLIFCVFLCRVPCTATQNLIQETCTKCAETDPNINLNFCVASLRRVPWSHNLRHLGLSSIHLLRRNLTNSKSYVEHLLKKTSLDPFLSSCLHDCLDLYSDAVPATRQALRYYEQERFHDANFGLSAVMDAATTCEDGFHEKQGIVSPLTRRNDDIFHLSALSLCIINMLSGSNPLYTLV